MGGRILFCAFLGALLGTLLTQVPDVTLNFGKPVPPELVPVHFFPCEPTLRQDGVVGWISYPSLTFIIGPIDTLDSIRYTPAACRSLATGCPTVRSWRNGLRWLGGPGPSHHSASLDLWVTTLGWLTIDVGGRLGLPAEIGHARVVGTSPPMPLGRGDVLALLTDGAMDAERPDGAPFGRERVVDVIGAHVRTTAQGMLDGLTGAIRGFRDGTPQPDDITAIICKCEGAGAG